MKISKNVGKLLCFKLKKLNKEYGIPLDELRRLYVEKYKYDLERLELELLKQKLLGDEFHEE